MVHFQLCSEFQMYFWWSWMTKLIFIWVRGRNLNGSQLFLPSPSLRPQKLHCFIHVGASWADSLKCVKKSKSTLHDEMTPVTTLVWKKKRSHFYLSFICHGVTAWHTHEHVFVCMVLMDLQVWLLSSNKLPKSWCAVGAADVLFIKLLCEKNSERKVKITEFLKLNKISICSKSLFILLIILWKKRSCSLVRILRG